MSKTEEYLKNKGISADTIWHDKKYYDGIYVFKSDALKAVRLASVDRLPINWRSNKEVVELVKEEIKKARKEERNKIMQTEKKLAKKFFSCFDSQDPSHNTNSWEKELKEVEARVRSEELNFIESLTTEISRYNCGMHKRLIKRIEIRKKFLESEFVGLDSSLKPTTRGDCSLSEKASGSAKPALRGSEKLCIVCRGKGKVHDIHPGNPSPITCIQCEGTGVDKLNKRDKK